MTDLRQILLTEIAAQGPITFADYMRRALYDPEHGYYSNHQPRTGRAGHFVTSPELDAAFGELWCAGFASVWEACGRPKRFDVIELGPGEGGFARAVLEAADNDFGQALRYVMVEPSALPRARQQESLRDPRLLWASSIAEVAVEAGCVFANEVLDNQPVHLVKSESQEVYVAVAGGELELVDGSVSSPTLLAYLEDLDLPAGTAMQVSPDTVALLHHAASSIERGALFFVDYGYEADEIAERGGNTVATYSSSGAASDPLAAPGEMDITAHVDWTAVRKALQEGLRTVGPLPQSDVLRALGLRTIDGRLRGQHQEALARGDGPGAVRILSRRNALGTLTNPGGLGGLGVMVATKGLEAGPEELLQTP